MFEPQEPITQIPDVCAWTARQLAYFDIDDLPCKAATVAALERFHKILTHGTRELSAANQAEAEAILIQVVTLRKEVEELYEPGAKELNARHKKWTGSRAALIKPLSSAESWLRDQLAALLARLERERLRKIEEATEAAAMEAEPWAISDSLSAGVAAQLFSAVPAPVSDNINMREGAWKVEVSMETLIEAACKNKSLQKYLMPNMAALESAAAAMGEDIGKFIPGVTATREKRPQVKT